MPFANQQFHDALDEIEVEIVCEVLPILLLQSVNMWMVSNFFSLVIDADKRNQLQAKAVMERDLSLLRKKRIERERIANGLKAQPSPEDAIAIPQPNENGPSEMSPTNNTAQNAGETKEEDTIMVDSALEVDFVGSEDKPQAEARPTKDGDNITSDQGMPEGAEASMGLAITMPADSATETAEPPKSPEKKSSGATPAAEVPVDSGTADLDFESMFNDTDLTGGDDAMNFGLDFSSDGNLNQDVLTDGAFANMEMSNADMPNLGATTSEDINTLLPGLENYVNAGTDFSNINISVAPSLPDTSQGASVGTINAPAQVSAPPVDANSNLDDLFGSGDFSMDGTGDDGMGAGTFGDLEDFDEEWFKTGST